MRPIGADAAWRELRSKGEVHVSSARLSRWLVHRAEELGFRLVQRTDIREGNWRVSMTLPPVPGRAA